MKPQSIDDILDANLKAETSGKMLKRVNLRENCNTLAYYSGGEKVLLITLKHNSFNVNDYITDDNSKIYKVSEVNKYENLMDIPQDIRLSEEVTSTLITENMKKDRAGYTVLILERQ